MRKLIASTFVSLDGFIAGPHGEMDWFMDTFSEDMGLEFAATQATQDTVLLGKKTYQIFTSYWPKQPDTNPAASFINHAKKIIISSHLQEVIWGSYDNATLLSGELEAAVTALKEQSGQDIVIPGSSSIVQQLTQAQLIDEYQLFLEPIVLGSGKKLFTTDQRIDLELKKSKAFSNGAVALYYQLIKSKG